MDRGQAELPASVGSHGPLPVARNVVRCVAYSTSLAGISATGEDMVHQARSDGAAQDAVILGGVHGLGHGHAAVFLDGLEAERAVGAGAGEDDADGVLALVFGQGGEEMVKSPGSCKVVRQQTRHFCGMGTRMVLGHTHFLFVQLESSRASCESVVVQTH